MAKAKNDQPHPPAPSDPLSAALLPPKDESPEARTLRVQAESEAKRRSERIDELLQQEKMEKKKARAEVNVLLLGQSESGKSTTLKRESSFRAGLCSCRSAWPWLAMDAGRACIACRYSVWVSLR